MIKIYQDPEEPTMLRLVYNEGDGGIFELNLRRVEYGRGVLDVPEGWPVFGEIPEEDD